MLFNSQAFLLFLPAAFLVFWSMDRAPVRARNLFLIGASYYFYARWDWRFLGLLAASSLADYLFGIAIDRASTPRARRAWLGLSIAFNLGILGFFKYFNFFIETLGIPGPAIRILLPVGLSFYTFQSLTYTIDIYRGRIQPTRDAVAFFAFVSFFPQLVAGPISRASHLLPQFLEKRAFDVARASDGLRQILWGFFKKVVVADNLAAPVAAAFSGAAGMDAPSLWAGAFLFAIQIYGDFSGYSDIAIGTGRLFGFDLPRNFAYPYFATSVVDFWRRWHISLSTWFRDYVYIPLGGSRARWAFNVMVTFTLSGLWHGARWTFVAWGALHGLLYLCWPRKAPAAVGWALTFVATTVAWVFFRAESFDIAKTYLVGMFGFGHGTARAIPVACLALGAGLLVAEIRPPSIERWPVAARWAAYYAVVLGIYFAGNLQHVPFIYFQF